MKEERSVDLDDGVVAADPFPVFPLGAEGATEFREAERVVSFPPFAIRVVELGRVAFRKRTLVFLVEFLPGLLGVGVPERVDLSPRQVPEVAVENHGFVIADEGVNRSAGLPGLVFEPHQEVHRLSGVGAAVEDVSGLDEMRLAAGPFALGIDQVGGPKDGHELIVVAVDVSDGDDPVDAGPDVFSRRSDRRPGDQEQEECSVPNRPPA